MATRILVDPHRVVSQEKPPGVLLPVPKFMADLGFDEIRAILDPLGQKIFNLVGEANTHAMVRTRSSMVYPSLPGAEPYKEMPGKVFRYVRCHNMFTGDDGDRQGAKNAGLVDVQYGPDGLTCDFTRLDAAYETMLEAGCIPFVELGFMPPSLALYSREAHEHDMPGARDEEVDFEPDDLEDNPLALVNCPPRSFEVWGELVRQTVVHLQEHFGPETIREWLFELWNEPDGLAFWSGTVDEYCRMFEVTAKTIKSIDPALRIGGPAVAWSTDFLEAFLKYVLERDVPLDFVSGHSKGGAPGNEPYPSIDRLMGQLRAYVKVLSKFPEFTSMDSEKRVPFLLNEADPFLSCVLGTRENPVYEFRETTYYPCFVALFYLELLDFLENEAPPWFSLHGVYSDNLHMIDERWPFGGYRNTATTVPVDASLADHPEVVVPWLLKSGFQNVPEQSRRWNRHGALVDRGLLFSVHPHHPAWNEPFIVVKKPIFHLYSLFQMLGEVRFPVSMDGDLPDTVRVLATASRATAELVVMLVNFHRDPGFKGAPAKVTVEIPAGFPLGSESQPDSTSVPGRGAIPGEDSPPRDVSGVDGAPGRAEAVAGGSLAFKECRKYELSPATCDAYEKWVRRYSSLEVLDRDAIDDLLKQNRLVVVPVKPEMVRGGKSFQLEVELPFQSVVVLVFKFGS